MEEERGVLGNLPRSRPGRRSQKRAGAQGKPARAAPHRQARRPRPPRPQAKQAPAADPVGDALKLASQVPLFGVRVAAGVTRGLLRRMPRP